ncbi:MAG: chloride channel protein [Proteobacteria bacterium]|nr:chloride channel protein [Pseudomonadota bacterium]MDA1356597.1 chloride channel protein [Pseudomonadota bacterium]
MLRLVRNEQVILSLLAVLIGVAAAYGSIGFRELIGVVQTAGYGDLGERLITAAAKLPWWQIVLVPTLGGLAVGLLVRYFQSGARPHGVADVMEASVLHGGRIPLKEGIVAALGAIISIGSGASVGREGPAVHIGASMASLLGHRLKLSRSLSLTLLGCGVAAAVAASFNAPIAGAFFALEVVIGHYALSAFAPVVIASVVGTIIARVHLGDFPAFVISDSTLVSFLELPAFALFGLVSAAVAVIFMRGILFTQMAWERTNVPGWLRPALAGAAIGAIAIVLPEILGVGYEATNRALNEAIPLWLLFALLAAKIAATSLSLGSGFVGGVFSPSLFIGAMTGGAFGFVAASIVPELSSSQSVYAIAGMGAVAGAVLGAPISTILIVFELTSSYEVTVVVMVAVAVAAVATAPFGHRSFFHMQLGDRGLDLQEGREVGLMREVRVSNVMTREFIRLAPTAGMGDIKRILSVDSNADIVVVDEDGRQLGMVGFADIKEVAFEADLDPLLYAADLLHRGPVILRADDELTTALRLMDASGVDRLPVVTDDESAQVIGVAHRDKALRAHSDALQAAWREIHGGGG